MTAPNKSLLVNLLSAGLAVWLLVLISTSLPKMLLLQATSGQTDAQRIPDWRALIVGRRPSLGTSNSRVVIMEFSDYECPFCRLMEPRLQRLVASHAGEVAIYRFNLPKS